MKRILPVCIASVLILIPLMGIGCGSDGDGENGVTITDPAIDLSDFTVYEKEQKLDDPRANEPTYVYLVTGQDAVRLAGPQVSSSVSIALENEAITKVDYDYFYSGSGLKARFITQIRWSLK